MITDDVIYVDAYYYITQNDLQELLYSVHDMHYIYNIQSLYICLGSRVIGHQYSYLCALVGPILLTGFLLLHLYLRNTCLLTPYPV